MVCLLQNNGFKALGIVLIIYFLLATVQIFLTVILWFPWIVALIYLWSKLSAVKICKICHNCFRYRHIPKPLRKLMLPEFQSDTSKKLLWKHNHLSKNAFAAIPCQILIILFRFQWVNAYLVWSYHIAPLWFLETKTPLFGCRLRPTTIYDEIGAAARNVHCYTVIGCW